MQGLSDTVARLAAARRAGNAASRTRIDSAAHLGEVADFGSDPGNLLGWLHLPTGLAPGAPLVVALHGCTQSAADYALGTGWSKLADQRGFAVLLPEQRRANNPNLCFNWFSPIDCARAGGEAESIRQMIATVVERHGLDARRVFVTGLSAGGAMTAVMLAAFPEVFAGGAVIAGLPYGCAETVPAAFEAMAGNLPAPSALAALVRGASPYDGPRPPVSIWHGTADGTVRQANADALLVQWGAVLGADAVPALEEADDRRVRRVWHDAAGRAVLEDVRIHGMGHGVPIGSAGANPVGRAAPYVLDVGISSTHHIAEGWGLSPAARASAEDSRPAPANAVQPRPATIDVADPRAMREPARPAAGPYDVKGTIERALRAAGLM